MRLSVDKNDAGYAAWNELGPRGRKAKVLLDGCEMKDVITADEESGVVLVLCKDEHGGYIRAEDELKKEWRHGKVEIVLPQEGSV